jgi:hypothetical protein
LKSSIVRIGFFEWMMLVNAVDVIESLFGEDLTRNLEAVLAVEEHVPLVRVAQTHQVRGEERGCRQLARPIQSERVHRFEHAVLDAIDQLEVADDFLGRERLEFELAAGLFLDRPAPGLECLETHASGPRRLHFPGGGFRSGRAADEWCRYRGGTDDSGCGLERPAPARLLDGFLLLILALDTHPFLL